MIGGRLEKGIEKFVARGFGASTRRFDGDKNGINFRQYARVLELEHPAILLLIVYIEDSQILSWTLGWSTCPPNLERCISPGSAPISQIKGIKDQ